MKLIQWICILSVLSLNSFSQTGPGGIGTNANLAFWVDANRQVFNNPIDSWLDISGNSVPTIVYGNPTRVTNALNGMSVIRFDGNADQLYTTLNISAVSWPQLSVLAVYVPRIQYSGSVWGEDNGEWDRFLTDITLTTQLNSCVGIGYGSNESSHILNLFNPGTPVLTTVAYVEGVYNGTDVYINGNNAGMFYSLANAAMENGTSTFYVGAIGSNGYTFDGDIAEVAVFRSDLPPAYRIITENYLAAKYGLTLSANDLYNEDNLGYDYDVAGIGSLGGFTNNNSQGTGLVRMWNPSNLNNGEFLFWGHDNGTLQAVNTIDVPTGVQARSGRVWKVSEVNTAGTSVDIGAINISFNLANLGSITASDLRLLVDSDNDGSFADETPIGSASSLGSNEYAFTAVSAIADNLRFTIATVDVLQTPLPVKLKYFNASVEEDAVHLSWQSLSEENILSYGINRSSDGIQWTRIGNTSAAGPGKYGFTDNAAVAGTSYYKLTEIDFNSREHFCALVSARKTNGASLTPFPNPTKNYLTIPLHGTNTQYRILNSSGLDCTKQTNMINRSETQVTIDVSALPGGQFFISVSGELGFHFIKESR